MSGSSRDLARRSVLVPILARVRVVEGEARAVAEARGTVRPPIPPFVSLLRLRISSCSDISFRNFKGLPPDPHHFDSDHDGIGCEP